jgi:predicted ribosome quality control (RQC) complex YloA/Tae2 family protein
VLVGKGSADNDELTFRIASPHDLWLHAKDRRGAHVIVPLRKSEALPDGALVDAATLAAHFSDARDEALVDVQYTSRKYVRKMKGGAAGAVVVEREKVLVLRVDKGKVAELLDGEEA